jgi:putative glycosyltransferase (TIGR04372 family)
MNSNEYYEFNNFKFILYFAKEEEILGKQHLKKMGIGENDWFVCFHSRDPSYLGEGSEYHDYRDSDINNYLPAAEYIAEQGGYAIRMGSVVDKPLPKERHPRIIDYAIDYRSDVMDIYLSAHCKFFLGNTAGLFLVSTIFDVPAACANFLPLEYTPLRSGDLFIPKKMWSRDKKKLLTYKEILDSGAGLYLESKQYENAGIEVIENSSDEILELAREMNMLLDKNYESMEEDEELQRRYISLFRPNHHCYGTQARIGIYFLRKNIELLDLRYAEKEKLFCQPIRNENLMKNHIK